MRRVLAGLLLLPVLELAVMIAVGRRIGPLPTLGALLLISLAGALLVRRQGAAAWRSLNDSLRAGNPPTRKLADATVLVIAGVLLLVPGFLTDVVALLLLFPPTRPLLRRPLERSFRRAAADRVTLVHLYGPGLGLRNGARMPGGPQGPGGFGQGPGGSGATRGGPGSPAGPPRFGGDVVEGEIVDDGN